LGGFASGIMATIFTIIFSRLAIVLFNDWLDEKIEDKINEKHKTKW